MKHTLAAPSAHSRSPAAVPSADLLGNVPGTYRAFGLDFDIAGARQRLWAHLAAQDDSLPAMPLQGCSESRGACLRVRCLRDDAASLFICDVVDLSRSCSWEAGICASASAMLTFWRGHLDAAGWAAVTGGQEGRPLQPRFGIGFLAVAAAYFGNGGTVLAEDVATRQHAESDLAYYRELCRNQDRLIRDMQRDLQNKSLWEARRKAGRVSHLAEHLTAASGQHVVEREWTLREIGEWAALNASRIVILPRAIAACRKSDYADPRLLFQALEILATDYVNAKRNEGPREAAKYKLAALGMEIGGSVDPSVAGMNGDAYFVQWRGRRRFLDQHVSKGTSRDPRFLLRIYFTWDEDSAVPVVGWLPSHLPCSIQ